MTPTAPQTVLVPSPAPLPSTSRISLMPFSLAHDGPARLSIYFLPRPYDPPALSDESKEAAEDAESRQASFRGRRIVSSTMPLPAGYRGLVYATAAPLPPSSLYEEKDETGSAERDDRAAKRAKRAAASAAALDALPATGSESDAAAPAEEGLRRSPRKAAAKAATPAAVRARERAVRAAKEKAQRRKAAAAKQSGGKFSLDSDEDDNGGEKEGGGETAARMGQSEAEPAPTSMPSTEPDQEQAADPAAPAEASAPTSAPPSEVSEGTSTAVSAPAPPTPVAPLRTASTASSTSTVLITSTPRATSPALPASDTAAAADLDRDADLNMEAPISLVRDEKRLLPVLAFDALEIWNPDFPLAGGRVAQDDEVGRAVTEWLNGKGVSGLQR
ncbi:hypothetical protein JCM8202v2_002214 [Rhodotorula sphaerocarpa]